jgi:DNA-binding SARP family transcriptional activator/WD40 repeat protein
VGARVRVLGSSRIDGQERMGRRDRVVLAALVAARTAVVPADRLAEALYGEQPAPTWRKAVQGSVARLRRALGVRAIETTPVGYRLTVGDDDIDARRFESLYQRAVHMIEVGQPARAVPMLREALALFDGEPLADLEDWDPGRDEAARLLELRRQAEERLVEALLAEGRLDEATSAGIALTGREPLREQRWVLLAQALYRADRQADALRAIDRARRLLRDELGVDPGPALVAIQRAVLQHDPSLKGRDDRTLPGTPTCPYKGLAAYDVEDTEVFFGRSEDIDGCVTQLLRTGALAIVGPSGSGKSSLVRAGVVPAVRRREQAVFVITPGPDPVARLAQIPADAAVVVDQLEELFTITADPAQRQAFAQTLARRAVRVPVAVTLRADFVAAVSTVPALARVVQSGLYLLGPMSEAQIRAAIEGPATRAGLRLEPGLVDLLVREVEGQSGALPLLSHALVETWSRRTDRILTVAGYQAGGGVQGAVAATADRVVDHLPPEGRRIARSVFLRLISFSDTGAPVRHRLRRADIVHDERSAEVVDALLAARLLITDAETIEVAHEALGRAWPRLRTWLDEDREGQRLLRHLAVSAAEWERTGRDPAELYRGARLRTAEEWVAATAPDLTPTERAFLDQSVARRRAEEEDLAARAEIHRRANRRLRWSLAAVVTLLVGALVASLVAVSQQGRAENEEREAALRALISRSEALRSTRRDLAALLAVEAHRLAPGPYTESALFGTFTASPGVERVVRVDAGHLQAGAIMSDGGTAALVDQRGSVHLVDDLARGAVTAVLETRHADEAVSYVARSADGRYFAVVSFRVKPTGEFADETRDELTVWDVRTGRRRFPDVPLPFHPGSVAFSPDGSLVAVGGGGDGRVSVYDAATGAHRLDVEPVPRPSDAFLLVSTVAVAFSPDGSLIIGAEAGPIRIVDPTTGRVRQRIEAPPLTAHYLLRVSSDGRSLTTVGVEGVAHYDLATRTALWMAEPPGGCNSLVPAERIGVLLCGEYSGTVLAIDLATGAIVGRRFDSHQGTVHDLLISPNGSTLIEVMSSAPVYVQWRLDGGGPVSSALAKTTLADIAHLNEGVLVATVSPAEATDSGDVWIIDADSGEALDPLAEVTLAVPTSNPSRLAAVFTDGTVGAYDLDRRSRAGPSIDPGFVPEGVTTIGDRALVWAGGRLQSIDLDRAALAPPEVDQEAVINMAVAPDSNHLLTLDGFYGLLQRRDPHTGDSLGEAISGFNLLAARGGTLVANTSDGQLLVLDPDRLTAVGAPLPAITGPAAAMALSGDGRRLAVLGEDRALRFYDVPSRTQLGDELPVGREGAAVAIRADGLQAAVATDQGVVIWDLDPDHWVDAACRLAGRNLTRAEWEFHLGDLARYRPTCPDYPAR